MAETKSLAEALAAFQAKLPSVVKSETANVKSDKGSYSYSYAGLGQISSVVLPLLGSVGLSFAAMPTVIDGQFVLSYRLLHVSGEELVGAYPLPSAGRPQEVGSAITYARRYVLCSVVGVAPDEDDDGQAAANTRVEARPQRQYDPNEQEVYLNAYVAEIEDAKTAEEITDIGQRVGRAKRSGELSPNTVHGITQAAAKRKAELNGAADAAV